MGERSRSTGSSTSPLSPSRNSFSCPRSLVDSSADINLKYADAVEKSQPQIGELPLIFLLVQGRLKAALDCGQIGEEPISDGHSEIEIAEIIGDVLAAGKPHGGLPALA